MGFSGRIKIIQGMKTDKKIEELKRQHETVYVIEVPVDDEGNDIAIGYLKKPGRKILAAVMSRINNDPLGANEMLLRNCWIEGDTRILDDDEIFLGACAALEDLIKFRRGVLKKT